VHFDVRHRFAVAADDAAAESARIGRNRRRCGFIGGRDGRGIRRGLRAIDFGCALSLRGVLVVDPRFVALRFGSAPRLQRGVALVGEEHENDSPHEHDPEQRHDDAERYCPPLCAHPSLLDLRFVRPFALRASPAHGNGEGALRGCPLGHLAR
jgi:hypothetical protein